MGNVTRIAPVKGEFVVADARAAAASFRRVTGLLAARLVELADARGVVSLTTRDACERTGYAVRALRQSFKELEAVGFIVRAAPWTFYISAEKCRELAEQYRAGEQTDRKANTPPAQDGAGAILERLRAGYRRAAAHITKRRGGLAVAVAPAFPTSKVSELVELVRTFAAEVGAGELEAADALAYAYVTHDHGAGERSDHCWGWLLTSATAKREAGLRLVARRRPPKVSPRSEVPPPASVDVAAAAAELARAIGGAR
jgi:hypothetical protein